MSAVEATDVRRPQPRRADDVRAGITAMVPFVVGYAPFALVIGTAAARTDDPLAAWSGSWLIFAGSAHLAVLRALDAGLLVAVAGGLLINARLLAYSASLAQRWRHQPRWFLLLGAALVVDPTWVAAERHAAESPSNAAQRRFFLAASGVLAVGWSTLIAVGVIVGGRLDAIDLEIVAPVCLAALLGPALREASARMAAAAAGAVAILGGRWPPGSALLLAIVAGAVAATARRGPTEDES